MSQSKLTRTKAGGKASKDATQTPLSFHSSLASPSSFTPLAPADSADDDVKELPAAPQRPSDCAPPRAAHPSPSTATPTPGPTTDPTSGPTPSPTSSSISDNYSELSSPSLSPSSAFSASASSPASPCLPSGGDSGGDAAMNAADEAMQTDSDDGYRMAGSRKTAKERKRRVSDSAEDGPGPLNAAESAAAATATRTRVQPSPKRTTDSAARTTAPSNMAPHSPVPPSTTAQATPATVIVTSAQPVAPTPASAAPSGPARPPSPTARQRLASDSPATGSSPRSLQSAQPRPPQPEPQQQRQRQQQPGSRAKLPKASMATPGQLRQCGMTAESDTAVVLALSPLTAQHAGDVHKWNMQPPITGRNTASRTAAALLLDGLGIHAYATPRLFNEYGTDKQLTAAVWDAARRAHAPAETMAELGSACERLEAADGDDAQLREERKHTAWQLACLIREHNIAPCTDKWVDLLTPLSGCMSRSASRQQGAPAQQRRSTPDRCLLKLDFASPYTRLVAECHIEQQAVLPAAPEEDGDTQLQQHSPHKALAAVLPYKRRLTVAELSGFTVGPTNPGGDRRYCANDEPHGNWQLLRRWLQWRAPHCTPSLQPRYLANGTAAVRFVLEETHRSELFQLNGVVDRDNGVTRPLHLRMEVPRQSTDIACAHCGTAGHTGGACPTKPADGSRTCKRCYTLGHIAAECLAAPEQLTCGICRQAGHPTSACKRYRPQWTKVDSRRPTNTRAALSYAAATVATMRGQPVFQFSSGPTPHDQQPTLLPAHIDGSRRGEVAWASTSHAQPQPAQPTVTVPSQAPVADHTMATLLSLLTAMQHTLSQQTQQMQQMQQQILQMQQQTHWLLTKAAYAEPLATAVPGPSPTSAPSPAPASPSSPSSEQRSPPDSSPTQQQQPQHQHQQQPQQLRSTTAHTAAPPETSVPHGANSPIVQLNNNPLLTHVSVGNCYSQAQNTCSNNASSSIAYHTPGDAETATEAAVARLQRQAQPAQHFPALQHSAQPQRQQQSSDSTHPPAYSGRALAGTSSNEQ